MEHGWCPTNPPGRTPIQIAGSFAVLLDFPVLLILDQPPECYGTWFESDQLPWSDSLEPTTKVLWNIGVSDQPTSSDTLACAQGKVIRVANIVSSPRRHSITADQWPQVNQTASSALVILASTPECYGTWFESDQLPWSDTHPDHRAFVVFRDYHGSWPTRMPIP